jgi:hypothetical protein
MQNPIRVGRDWLETKPKTCSNSALKGGEGVVADRPSLFDFAHTFPYTALYKGAIENFAPDVWAC